MKLEDNLTRDHLKELIYYNPLTGVFTWKKGRMNQVLSGDRAGMIRTTKDGRKYRDIYINGKHYLEHRLVWLYMYGEWPINDIDHIDHNGANNALSNLRSVTRAENLRNRTKRPNNISGIVGVHFEKESNKWKAQINDNKKKRKNLGRFKDFFEACCARKSAEIIYKYHPNHGMEYMNDD